MIASRHLAVLLLAQAGSCWADQGQSTPPIQLAANTPPAVSLKSLPASTTNAQLLAAPLPPTDALSPALESKLDDLSRRVSLLAEQLRSQGLLSMHNQLEGLKSEVAKLRGKQEELQYAQQVADKRQKDLLADFDLRLKEMAKETAKRPPPPPPEPVRPQATATPATATPPAPPPRPAVTPADAEMETKSYESALNHFKSADYVAAVSAFNAFVVGYPNSALASNAMYWLGLSYYALADFKSSAEAQQRLLKDYPQSGKVPDATLSLARAHMQLGDSERARAALEQVVAKFPTARAADTARKMLTLFK